MWKVQLPASYMHEQGNSRTWGNGFKLSEGRFATDIKENFFTMRHRLPREAVAALSMKTFKVSLDRALSNLI